MSHESRTHPDSERLQALAEGELHGAAQQAAEQHLQTCARCRAEFEGWTVLFREIKTLPRVGPSAEFTEQVMARIRHEEAGAEAALAPSTGGFRGLLSRIARGLGGGATDIGHLSDVAIQEHLDGLAARGEQLRTGRHLEGCTACRGRVREWQRVFAKLSDLPHLVPAEGFAERVLDRTPTAAIVRGQAAASSPSLGERLRRAARTLIPATPRGWTVAGGLVAAPSLGVLAAVVGVVAHPLLTFRDLGIYLSWQVTEAAAAAWSGVMELAVGNPWAATLAQALLGIAESPALAAVAMLALWAATLLAGSVLYRYLIAPTHTAGYHAKAS